METIAEAKEFLKEHAEQGTECPACGQHVQYYQYPLFLTSALALIDLYKATKITGEDYHHVSGFAEARQGKPRAPHFAELRFWGLVEAKNRKTATDNASGFWKITDKGKNFVLNRIRVPKYIVVFNNHFVGFRGEEISITQALKNKFDYVQVIGTFFEEVKDTLFS